MEYSFFNRRSPCEKISFRDLNTLLFNLNLRIRGSKAVPGSININPVIGVPIYARATVSISSLTCSKYPSVNLRKFFTK